MLNVQNDENENENENEIGNDPEKDYENLNDAISTYKKTMGEHTTSPKYLMNKNSIFNRLKFVDLILINKDSDFLDLKIKLEINSTRNKKLKMFNHNNVIQFTTFFELTNNILKRLQKDPKLFSVAFFRENLEKISSDNEILNYTKDRIYVKISERNKKRNTLMVKNNFNNFNKTATGKISFLNKKEIIEEIKLNKTNNNFVSFNEKELEKSSNKFLIHLNKKNNMIKGSGSSKKNFSYYPLKEKEKVKKISFINTDFDLNSPMKNIKENNNMNEITEIKKEKEDENENEIFTNNITELDNNNTVMIKDIKESIDNNKISDKNSNNESNNNITMDKNETIFDINSESENSPIKSINDPGKNSTKIKLYSKELMNSDKSLIVLNQIDMSNSIIKDNIKKKDIFSIEILNMSKRKIKDGNENIYKNLKFEKLNELNNSEIVNEYKNLRIKNENFRIDDNNLNKQINIVKLSREKIRKFYRSADNLNFDFEERPERIKDDSYLVTNESFTEKIKAARKSLISNKAYLSSIAFNNKDDIFDKLSKPKYYKTEIKLLKGKNKEYYEAKKGSSNENYENNLFDFFQKKINPEDKKQLKVKDTNSNKNHKTKNRHPFIKNNFPYKKKEQIRPKEISINNNNTNNNIIFRSPFQKNDQNVFVSPKKFTSNKNNQIDLTSPKILESFFKAIKINSNTSKNINSFQMSNYYSHKFSFTRTFNNFSKFSNIGNSSNSNANTNTKSRSNVNFESYVPFSPPKSKNKNKFSLNINSQKEEILTPTLNPNNTNTNSDNNQYLNTNKSKKNLEKIRKFLDIENGVDEKEKEMQFREYLNDDNIDINEFKKNLISKNNRVTSINTEKNIELEKKMINREKFYEKISNNNNFNIDLKTYRLEFKRFKSKSEMRFSYMNYPSIDIKVENEVKYTNQLIKNFIKNNLNNLIPNEFIDENLKDILIKNVFKPKKNTENGMINIIENNNNISEDDIDVNFLDFKRDNLLNNIISVETDVEPFSLTKIDYDTAKEFIFFNYLNSRSIDNYFLKRIKNNEMKSSSYNKMINTSLMFLSNNQKFNYTNLNSTGTADENWFNSKNHKLILELFNLPNNSKQVSELNSLVEEIVNKLKKDISGFLKYMDFLSKNKRNMQLKHMALDLIFVNLYLIEIDKKLIDYRIVHLFVEFICDEKEKKMFYDNFKKMKIIGIDFVDENVEFYKYQFLLLKRFLKMITNTTEENLEIVKKEFSITDEEIYFILFSKNYDIKGIVNDIYFVNKITNVFRILVSSINYYF